MDTSGVVDLAARAKERDEREASRRANYWAEKLADQIPPDMSYVVILVPTDREDEATMKSNLEGEDVAFLLESALKVVRPE